LDFSSLNLLERFFSRTLAPDEGAEGASPVTMMRSAGGEPGESSTSAAAERTMERRSGTAAAAAAREVDGKADADDADVDALAADTGAQRARSMAAVISRAEEDAATLLEQKERAGANWRGPARGGVGRSRKKGERGGVRSVEVEFWSGGKKNRSEISVDSVTPKSPLFFFSFFASKLWIGILSTLPSLLRLR
jgi:hypothetical protein